MKINIAKEILEKYLTGVCSDEERALLEAWYEDWHKNESEHLSEAELQAAFSRLDPVISGAKPKKISSVWLAFGVAAALAAMIFGAFLFIDLYEKSADGTASLATSNDIDPGSYSATLTLSNGRKIKLDRAVDGKVAEESGIRISKTSDGRLLYQINDLVDNDKDSRNGSNTLSTANGETYQIKLPDGSLVHLNAASSLTYRLSLLEGGRRLVKLTGEGYFEVAKDLLHPFIVQAGDQEVQVLGTHFNICAYEGEAVVKTTLLEGSVRLNNETVLKPGQQAVASNRKISVHQVDLDETVAWKNGEFFFDQKNFYNTMNMIARWYDVEIVYDYQPINLHLAGQISRSRGIKEVLEILENTDEVKFKIEGRRVRVIK